MRVASRCPTSTSNTNDFQEPFDDIWGVRGHRFRPMLGVPGVWGGLNKYMSFIMSQRSLR